MTKYAVIDPNAVAGTLTRQAFMKSALRSAALVVGATLMPALPAVAGASAAKVGTVAAVRHKTVKVDGLDIFYREAGPMDGPVVLLLHGFPTSSQQYRNLIPALAERYRVVAPDYPGYGRSSMPASETFTYTFAAYAKIVDKFTQQLGLSRYALYVMDYGAPVGFRLAVAHPERVTALVIQNGNAYDEGLRDFWVPFKAYWMDNAAKSREELRKFLVVGATEWQYTHGVPEANKALVSPDAWMLDQAYLNRPGNQEIQLDLFYDYRTNVAMYPAFQSYFRAHQPPTLIVWGKNDYIFPAEGAAPYLRDLPRAELHLLDAGHFALETNGAEIAARMWDFLGRNLNR